MATYYLNTDDKTTFRTKLKTFDRVFLSGTIYTARDAAHKQMLSIIKQNNPPLIPIDGSIIYYAGPTATPDGLAIGSCGPTTAGRMDKYAPTLLDMGLVMMIGKGERSPEVIEAIKRNKAVYLCAVGGAGALACECIKKCEVVALPELGCESIKKLTIENFPLIVAIDSEGTDIFSLGREKYKI